MIVVIVGPSGSGKTTYINELISKFNFGVINVDVCSDNNTREYKNDSGRTSVSKHIFLEKRKKGLYTFINEYSGSLYGYSFPENHENRIILLDYPGEYPSCIELKSEKWKGVLILPPSKDELIARLKKTGRTNRINSATKEYDECIDDINSHNMDDWEVIVNKNLDQIKALGILLSKTLE